jgi:hypothetical protein
MIDIADAGLRWDASGKIWVVGGDPALAAGECGRLGAEKRVGESRRGVAPFWVSPGGVANYLNRVMRKSPQTVKKPRPDPSASVIAIAVPPSKANAPTIAMANRLT